MRNVKQMQSVNNFYSSTDFCDFQQNYIYKKDCESYPQNNSEFCGQISQQIVQQEINHLNETLRTICNEQIGDLFSNQPLEIKKTLLLINSLISMRHKDIQIKNQLHSNSRRNQTEKIGLSNQVERLTKEKKNLENERENLMFKIKNNQRTYKDNIDKIISEKEEAIRQFKAIQSRQNQFRTEHRKNQNTIKQLQDKLNKFQDKTPFKNNFEIFQKLQNYGPTLIVSNAENQFNQMISKNADQNYYQITNQNQYLKDYIMNTDKQLNQTLEIKKQILIRKGCQTDYENIFELNKIKPQTFKLPRQKSKNSFIQLSDNVMKFKSAIRMGDHIDEDYQDQKINCVNNVKGLIKNYKTIVQNQDQLLNKVILKSKDFKANDMTYLQNRFEKLMDQQQMEKAKRFIEQQNKYLEVRNKQVELTRKAMQTTIKRAQQSKSRIIQKKNHYNEEANKLANNLQALPSMITEELQKI